MTKPTYGELLFEQYLTAQDVKFEREPELPGIRQRIDFVTDHPTHGKILLEVKDIENAMPNGGGAFDPYRAIREHIEEGTRKFRATSRYVNALVLAAPPGSFVNFETPYVMLGAMYGDYGFKIPFNSDLGHHDASQMTSEFLLGRGKVVRRSRLQNTRIAALVTLHNFHLWNYAMRKYLNTDDRRTRLERGDDVESGRAPMPEYDATAVGVTVWQNATATKRLPPDLFRGNLDAWCEVTEEGQGFTYIGDYRRELGIDKL
jgi:hypothetical protein